MALVRRTLDPSAAGLLRQLVTGLPLEQALQVLVRDAVDTDTTLRIVDGVKRWFAEWTKAGFFAELGDTTPG
jgi:hypothetical protein